MSEEQLLEAETNPEDDKIKIIVEILRKIIKDGEIIEDIQLKSINSSLEGQTNFLKSGADLKIKLVEKICESLNLKKKENEEGNEDCGKITEILLSSLISNDQTNKSLELAKKSNKTSVIEVLNSFNKSLKSKHIQNVMNANRQLCKSLVPTCQSDQQVILNAQCESSYFALNDPCNIEDKVIIGDDGYIYRLCLPEESIDLLKYKLKKLEENKKLYDEIIKFNQQLLDENIK